MCGHHNDCMANVHLFLHIISRRYPAGGCSRSCGDVFRLSGGCLEVVWRLPEGCLKVAGGYPEVAWRFLEVGAPLPASLYGTSPSCATTVLSRGGNPRVTVVRLGAVSMAKAAIPFAPPLCPTPVPHCCCASSQFRKRVAERP